MVMAYLHGCRVRVPVVLTHRRCSLMSRTAYAPALRHVTAEVCLLSSGLLTEFGRRHQDKKRLQLKPRSAQLDRDPVTHLGAAKTSSPPDLCCWEFPLFEQRVDGGFVHTQQGVDPTVVSPGAIWCGSVASARLAERLTHIAVHGSSD